jgi:hypothetical protein
LNGTASSAIFCTNHVPRPPAPLLFFSVICFIVFVYTCAICFLCFIFLFFWSHMLYKTVIQVLHIPINSVTMKPKYQVNHITCKNYTSFYDSND